MNISKIIAEELEKFHNSEKGKSLAHMMENINPSEHCIICDKFCGKQHVICSDCYAKRGIGSI